VGQYKLQYGWERQLLARTGGGEAKAVMTIRTATMSSFLFMGTPEVSKTSRKERETLL
jgi:hypothetical protein